MLDDAFDESVDSGATLRVKLREKERAAEALIAGGSLSSISKNQSSHTYAFGRGNITPLEIVRGWRLLINVYDKVLETASDVTDAAVKAEMMRKLQPVNEFTKDFQGLHCV